MTTDTLTSCPLFINGEWIDRTDLPTSPVHNPSIGSVITETPLADSATVEQVLYRKRSIWPMHKPSEMAPQFSLHLEMRLVSLNITCK